MPGDVKTPGMQKLLVRLEPTDWTHQVAHRANATAVTRIGEAAEVPIVLNRRHHGIVIEGVSGTPRKT
jgi:hypothetical protein